MRIALTATTLLLALAPLTSDAAKKKSVKKKRRPASVSNVVNASSGAEELMIVLRSSANVMLPVKLNGCIEGSDGSAGSVLSALEALKGAQKEIDGKCESNDSGVDACELNVSLKDGKKEQSQSLRFQRDPIRDEVKQGSLELQCSRK